MPRSEHHHIERYDNEARSTHAWMVRLQRKKRIETKMFSDSVFGGREKALSAAILYRDAMLVAAAPAAHNRWHRSLVRKNSKTGIPGVSVFTRKDGKERWMAYWNDENGVWRSRSFSVGVYSDRVKELAIAERQKQLDRIFEIKCSDQKY